MTTITIVPDCQSRTPTPGGVYRAIPIQAIDNVIEEIHVQDAGTIDRYIT